MLSSLASSTGHAIVGNVRWSHAAVLAVGAAIGSTFGASRAGRLRPRTVLVLVACGLAGRLACRPSFADRLAIARSSVLVDPPRKAAALDRDEEGVPERLDAVERASTSTDRSSSLERS